MLPRQQGQDHVLDPGGVLGLVQAEPAVAAAVVGQDLRLPAEDAQGKDHLVVKVHETAAAQIVLVLEVYGGKIHPLHRVAVDIGLGEHHVLAVGDVGPGLLDLLLGGKVAAGALEQVPENGIQVGVAVGQGEGLRALPPGIGVDDGGAQTVDGAEGELPCQVLPEEGGKPPGHVSGGGDGVGDGEDLLWRDATAVDEAAQPGHQYGGLAAARHRQQQHGTRSGPHRRFLLFTQRQGQ